MTACPSPGALRDHLDVPDLAVEAHASECDDCALDLRRVAEAAGITVAAFRAISAPPVPTADETEAALVAARSQLFRSSAEKHTPQTARALSPGSFSAYARKSWFPRAAVAAGVMALAVLAVMTPAGRQAAADLLDVFRPERIEVVTVDPSTPLDALGSLENIGTFHFPDGQQAPQPVVVADAAEASAVSGLAVTLPDAGALAAAGVAGVTPSLGATAPTQVELTLDRDLQPALPEAVDGTTVVFGLPGAVVAVYGAAEPVPGDAGAPPLGDLPQLVYVQSGVPTAVTEGASLEEVRAALLALADLPPETRAQLEAISDWRRTLPLPLPFAGPRGPNAQHSVAWREIGLPNGEALAFGDETGVAAAVLWQRPDGIHAVGGTLPSSAAIGIAEAIDG